MAFNKETFIEELKEMSVLDLNELVKAIEEEFGVSAAAPVAVAAAGDGAADAGSSEVDVVITDAGSSKLAVIKVIRSINAELGLKEAKAVADDGGVIKAGVAADEAEELKAQLEEAGATIELK
jgi:large subunit ribosomal protein L7/L12